MNVEEAINWISDLFEEPSGSISADTSRAKIPAWDSLGILTLMARLDEDFGILLEEEELQQLRSVNDILDTMRRYGVLNNRKSQ